MSGQEAKPSGGQRPGRRFFIVPIVTIAVTALIFIAIYITMVRRVQYVYTNQTYQNAVALKRSMLSETVESLVAEIEQTRARRLLDETGLIRGLKPAVQARMDAASGADAVSAALRDLFADNGALTNITTLLYDSQSGKIRLDEKGLAGETALWTPELAEAFAVREEVSSGGLTAVYGITESAFDKEVLGIFAGRLEIFSREEGVRYWIDRITRLDSGQVSAVRVLDPVEPGRVGMSLDSGGRGNGPDKIATDGLLDELAGQQVFRTGSAEWKENSGQVVTAQTLTCAEYYPAYGWAVCGAFRLDRVGIDAMTSQEVSRKQTFRLGVQMAAILAAVLAVTILLILRNNVNYFNLRQRKLRDQVERDALTGANTRGYGQQLLMGAFRRFDEHGEMSPVLMVLDVDKFKSINDTYGHDGGDEALKRVVKSAMKVGRGKDCVIRWGGDEFIAVFYKLERARCEAVANKLRRAIGDTLVKHGGQTFQVTVSVGVTWFKLGDADYTEALRRADAALYESKEQGRNRVCIAEA